MWNLCHHHRSNLGVWTPNPLLHWRPRSPGPSSLFPWGARCSPSPPPIPPPYSCLPLCPSFVINFKVGSSGDVALHINPRVTEGAVVRNSFLNGSWGSEERKVSYNPFGPGQFFDVSLGFLSLLPSEASVLALASYLPFSLQLSVRCGADRFKVYADGQHLFDFSHRLSAFQRVDLVEIHGDVTLSYVQIWSIPGAITLGNTEEDPVGPFLSP